MNKKALIFLSLLVITLLSTCILWRGFGDGPDWPDIKSNTVFTVADNTYGTPHIQPLHNGGWEDGLYISRDGLNLYSIYLPMDVMSLYKLAVVFPTCFDYTPYYRPPTLGVDLVTNPWGCKNFFQGDIIISRRGSAGADFPAWSESGLQRSVSNEGAPCGVLNAEGTGYEYFAITMNRADTEDLEIMLMKNTGLNPQMPADPYGANSGVTPIVSSTGVEDNPHIEKLADGSLVLIFDRDRYMYYSTSTNGGDSWSTPVQITNVLNDQAPYDVQPHLWNDGSNWWVYFCADNDAGKRSIYRSRQQTTGSWDSWAAKELVIEPKEITGYPTALLAIGEPTLTDNGDLSFVCVYGEPWGTNKTDRYDCDPWFLPKK